MQIHNPPPHFKFFFYFHTYESYSTVYSSVQEITIMHFNSICADVYTIVVLLFFHLLDPIFYWDFMLPLCSYMYCFVDPVLWDNSIPRNLLSATYYIHAGVVTVCVTLYIFCFCFLYYYYYYKFFVYFCVLFFFFCVFYSSNLTSCHATNVNQVFVFVLLAAKFLCDCSRFLTSYFYHKVDNG